MTRTTPSILQSLAYQTILAFQGESGWMVETVPTLSKVKGSPEGPTVEVYLMAALLASGQIFP